MQTFPSFASVRVAAARQSVAQPRFRVLPTRAATVDTTMGAGQSFAVKRLAYVLELVGSCMIVAAFLALAILA
jgi:hypothetical protein